MERTRHYGLVIFTENDKPTWLNNWNETMSLIDEVLYRISSGGGDLPDLSEVVARLEVLESQMSSANLQIQQNANNITVMQGSIETINTTLAELADADTELESEISGINLTITNIQTSLGTISEQLSNIQSIVSGLDTRITHLESKSPTAYHVPLYTHLIRYVYQSGYAESNITINCHLPKNHSIIVLKSGTSFATAPTATYTDETTNNGEFNPIYARYSGLIVDDVYLSSSPPAVEFHATSDRDVTLNIKLDSNDNDILILFAYIKHFNYATATKVVDADTEPSLNSDGEVCLVNSSTNFYVKPIGGSPYSIGTVIGKKNITYRINSSQNLYIVGIKENVQYNMTLSHQPSRDFDIGSIYSSYTSFLLEVK